MAFVKRIGLFLLVNFLILTTVSIVWSLVGSYFGIENSYYGYLVTFSLVAGMGGAFFSLMISKWSAKKLMGVQIIDPETAQGEARQLVEAVHNLARQARLPKMPEVGIYEAPDMNAFATGPSKSNSLVAVSTGLLRGMNKEELEGVLGHEVAHIANGDMVTMTLLQGIINALVLFFARFLANIIASQSDENKGPIFHFILVMAFQIAFSVLGSLVVYYFSRKREFRADLGAAKIAGRDKMIAALKALESQRHFDAPEQEALATLQINSNGKKNWMALFSSHPPLEDRIKALETGMIK